MANLLRLFLTVTAVLFLSTAVVSSAGPPEPQSKFKSPEELKQYLKSLEEYLAYNDPVR